MIAASVPPARTTSACPRVIVAAPSPIAVEPVAHAETGAKFGPVSPSWIAIWPLAVSTSAEGMKNGETRSAPRSRKTACCSAIVAIPPIAEPTRIPTRAGSNSSMPASTHASLRGGDGEQDVAVHAARLLRRDERSRIEAAHLTGDPHRELARVERLDEADAAAAGDRRLPGRGRVEADRRDGSEPGDDNAAHEAKSVVACGDVRCTRASRRARPARPVPADGGRARPRATARGRLGLRAEMGRIPRRARERRRRAAALVAQRPAAAALLPGASAARRAVAATLRRRRRDRDRHRRCDRLRRDADAPASRREPHPQALRRDPGAVRRLRHSRLGRRRHVAAAVRGAPRRARAGRRRVRALARRWPTPRPRRRGSTSSRRSASTASSRSGSTGPSSREAAGPSSR